MKAEGKAVLMEKKDVHKSGADSAYDKISQEAYGAAKELIETAQLRHGEILVVGCSTSE